MRMRDILKKMHLSVETLFTERKNMLLYKTFRLNNGTRKSYAPKNCYSTFSEFSTFRNIIKGSTVKSGCLFLCALPECGIFTLLEKKLGGGRGERAVKGVKSHNPYYDKSLTPVNIIIKSLSLIVNSIFSNLFFLRFYGKKTLHLKREFGSVDLVASNYNVSGLPSRQKGFFTPSASLWGGGLSVRSAAVTHILFEAPPPIIGGECYSKNCEKISCLNLKEPKYSSLRLRSLVRHFSAIRTMLSHCLINASGTLIRTIWSVLKHLPIFLARKSVRFTFLTSLRGFSFYPIINQPVKGFSLTIRYV